jgi:hypothetical protein
VMNFNEIEVCPEPAIQREVEFRAVLWVHNYFFANLDPGYLLNMHFLNLGLSREVPILFYKFIFNTVD